MKTLKDKIAELPIEDQIKIHNRAARLIEMELRRALKFKGFLLIVSCILLLYVMLLK
jgi:hypothetical protein